MAAPGDTLAGCQTQFEDNFRTNVVCAQGDYEVTDSLVGGGVLKQMKHHVINARAGRRESGTEGIYFGVVAFDMAGVV